MSEVTYSLCPNQKGFVPNEKLARRRAREGAACAEGDELMTCAFMSSQYDEHAKHSRLIALTVAWGGGGNTRLVRAACGG